MTPSWHDMETLNMESIDGSGLMTDLPDVRPGQSVTFIQQISEHESNASFACIRGRLVIDDVDIAESLDARWNGPLEFSVRFDFPHGLRARRYGLRYVFLSRSGEWKQVDWMAGSTWPAERVRKLL